MAGLLYGSGLRLMECLPLQVKDVGLARNEITVREGKGGKDRKTVLPARLRAALQAQLDTVRVTHARDLDAGFGAVSLPHALARKYRNAERELGWQYVSRPRSARSIRWAGARSVITWTKACCNGRYAQRRAGRESTSR